MNLKELMKNEHSPFKGYKVSVGQMFQLPTKKNNRAGVASFKH
jgi:hypothetical protein